jgi:hypothetical protein
VQLKKFLPTGKTKGKDYNYSKGRRDQAAVLQIHPKTAIDYLLPIDQFHLLILWIIKSAVTNLN